MIEVTTFVHKLIIVPSVSCVVQLTYLSVQFIIDTDAVIFVVAKQLTDIKIDAIFISYDMVNQTFVSVEKRRRKRKCTTITCRQENSN